MQADVFAVLCTGPSMSLEVAESVRHLRVVAVNGAYEFAPWAEALAANDMAWWMDNPQAKRFAGRKFSASRIDGVEQLKMPPSVNTNTCSGVLGLEVAKLLGMRVGYLFGADFHGDHYFGKYTGRCKNTSPDRRRIHAAQFARWGAANSGIQIFNATEGSALACFPMVRFEVAAVA